MEGERRPRWRPGTIQIWCAMVLVLVLPLLAAVVLGVSEAHVRRECEAQRCEAPKLARLVDDVCLCVELPR